MTLSITIESHYVECRIFLLLYWMLICSVLLCWMLYWWVSLCWILLYWVSSCRMLLCWMSWDSSFSFFESDKKTDGARTLRITKCSITTFSIINLNVTLSINDTQHSIVVKVFYFCAECCYAVFNCYDECRIFYCNAECRYAEYLQAECCSAECRYVECHGTELIEWAAIWKTFYECLIQSKGKYLRDHLT